MIRAVLVATMLGVGQAAAQHPKPSGMSLKEMASHRFPQPVRAGDLLHRSVLQPLESQRVLGHVAGVVRAPDGDVEIVVDYGGLFGFWARPIAVPVEAMVLVGDTMEVLDFTPAQLDKFPTFKPSDAKPIADGEMIQVGLAKPSH